MKKNIFLIFIFKLILSDFFLKASENNLLLIEDRSKEISLRLRAINIETVEGSDRKKYIAYVNDFSTQKAIFGSPFAILLQAMIAWDSNSVFKKYKEATHKDNYNWFIEDIKDKENPVFMGVLNVIKFPLSSKGNLLEQTIYEHTNRDRVYNLGLTLLPSFINKGYGSLIARKVPCYLKNFSNFKGEYFLVGTRVDNTPVHRLIRKKVDNYQYLGEFSVPLIYPFSIRGQYYLIPSISKEEPDEIL